LPQTGITQEILAGIQLANEQHAANQRNLIAQQQTALQQQAQPSEIALRGAQAAQAQAEVQAIPRRLDLMQKEQEATLALRDVIAKSEANYRQGMLGVRTSEEQRKALKDQADIARDMMRTNIQAQAEEARKQGIQGMLAFHSKALAQQGQLMEQGLVLRDQANQLRKQGNEIAAEARENQADQILDTVGVWREFAGEIGLAPEVRTPGAATKTNPTPKAAAPQLTNPY
jgi:hypothetical protein